MTRRLLSRLYDAVASDPLPGDPPVREPRPHRRPRPPGPLRVALQVAGGVAVVTARAALAKLTRRKTPSIG